MKKRGMFDQIDDWFATKKSSESQMYIGLAFLLVVGLIYLILFPISQSYFDESQERLDKTSKDLANVEADLTDYNMFTEDNDMRTKKEKNTLAVIQRDVADLQDANKYVDDKLREVATLTYNEKNWAKFLDELTLLAQQNNIKLYELHSDVKELESGKVQEVLDVSLNVEGTFNNMLKYINSIEESEMVVDINGLDLNSTGKNIAGDVNISLWGMKYDNSVNIDPEKASAELNQNAKKGAK